MGEIKFRGKYAGVPGGWVYGYFVKEYGDWYIINDDVKFGVIVGTVGQYIRDIDVNGKEIYEGDILKTTIDFRPIYVVKSIEDYWSDRGYMSEIFENAKFEIIGNIYENPDLLKKGWK